MTALYVSPQMRLRAKALALQAFKETMDIGAKVPNVAELFEVMSGHLAFARLLEEKLLASLRRCPDRELAREIEESAAGIAAELERDLVDEKVES